MLGRKLIMCERKAPDAPSVSSWFSQLGHLAALDKLSFRLMNKVDLYVIKWKPTLSALMVVQLTVNSLNLHLIVTHCKNMFFCSF